MEVKIENAEEVIIKTVKPHGNGANVLVPKAWIGKQVKVVLLEEEE